ncbi:hypothetical protein AVEN_18379-1 [Araneus ventricosus]|uniref:Uncharacterized protein n=1 Tax=Araneus ventricosus TaxID=182803 RepID=A0A4Y2DCL0_ARAVE|nr:hypothetical protein AVEN_152219-1 [Araneus ventricosus]GBM23614.1 hypothetical protein AVEN_18379-1 [Araneus ventricosus]
MPQDPSNVAPCRSEHLNDICIEDFFQKEGEKRHCSRFFQVTEQGYSNGSEGKGRVCDVLRSSEKCRPVTVHISGDESGRVSLSLPDSKESLSERFWKPCRRQG